MGEIHHLIRTHGVDQARQLVSEKLDRQCIDAAFAVMTEEDPRVGIMHAGFAMTALPHRNPGVETWCREGGNVMLRIDSGTDREGTPIGVPYGSIARMILLYLQTEAVKTRSREIPLGRSMNRWLGSMGIDNGGKTYKLVREQARRLSLCRLTFYRQQANGEHITNGSFVRDAILPSRDNDQTSLWQETVRLDEGFYESLISHPMPVLEQALRQIGGRSMAIDVYVWLAYRLHHLDTPLPVSWRALYSQFGAGYNHIRQFRAKFREPLSLALAVYPEAHVTADSDGLVLYPSASPVPQTRLG